MDLIYVKDIDKSLLYQGFTIRTSLLKYFMEKFKKLSIGENRKISIILNDKIYTDIQVINQNFNRENISQSSRNVSSKIHSSACIFPSITHSFSRNYKLCRFPAYTK